jgi:hypothetical protein
MGAQAQQIHDRAVDPRIHMIERDELRKRRLKKAERWEEFYSLLFALGTFTVSHLFALPPNH